MSAAIGLGLVGLQLLAGLALARRLGPVGDPWWARAAWAYALGGAVIGLLQIALSALGLPASWIVPAVCAAVSGSESTRTQLRTPRTRRAPPRRRSGDRRRRPCRAIPSRDRRRSVDLVAVGSSEEAG